jgi:hypothetical protein
MATDNTDQILIKQPNSPYYIVQPPAYDWDHPDTQADIKYKGNLMNKFFNPEEYDENMPMPTGPKLLEPWKYRLASEYNNQYNIDNNITYHGGGTPSWTSDEEEECNDPLCAHN